MVSFDFSQPSILRRMFLAFLGFGLGMGLIFPIFANLFVDWKEGMLTWFILACIIAGVSIGIFNYWLLNKMLLRRLMNIGEVANAISNNDISHKCSLLSNDFIGDMANSFNLMAGNLQTMVKRIAEVSDKLNNASNDMGNVTQSTQQGIQEQQQGSAQVAESIASLTQTSLGMSENTQAAFSAADQAQQATNSGEKVVAQSVASINALAEEVENTAQVIQRFKKDSENIGSVLDVIKDIAEQTNLLALNAAIEAARAGENGRGFAVVADEVRVLASRTQDSTIQIETMIAQLQDISLEAVHVMQHGRDKAHESVNQANKAGEALQNISAAVTTISQMNSQITDAAENQRQQAQLMNQNMTNITQISEHVANDAQQTKTSSEAVANYADELNHLIKQFKF